VSVDPRLDRPWRGADQQKGDNVWVSQAWQALGMWPSGDRAGLCRPEDMA
jgi:hypothetical protein